MSAAIENAVNSANAATKPVQDEIIALLAERFPAPNLEQKVRMISALATVVDAMIMALHIDVDKATKAALTAQLAIEKAQKLET